VFKDHAFQEFLIRSSFQSISCELPAGHRLSPWNSPGVFFAAFAVFALNFCSHAKLAKFAKMTQSRSQSYSPVFKDRASQEFLIRSSFQLSVASFQQDIV
jgi:hypothetical protein